jgi:hypothetical protein
MKRGGVERNNWCPETASSCIVSSNIKAESEMCRKSSDIFGNITLHQLKVP